jgi:hypothetical protein
MLIIFGDSMMKSIMEASMFVNSVRFHFNKSHKVDEDIGIFIKISCWEGLGYSFLQIGKITGKL